MREYGQRCIHNIYLIKALGVKQINREELISSCHVLNVNQRSHEHEPQNYAASQSLQTKILVLKMAEPSLNTVLSTFELQVKLNNTGEAV